MLCYANDVLRSQINKREGVWTAGLDGKLLISLPSNLPHPNIKPSQTSITLINTNNIFIETQDSTRSELYPGLEGCQASSPYF